MASASNVTRSLAIGGVAPVQAQQIANQLTNLSRSQLSRGPVQVDYTPQDMRLITSDARKYRFPNLDWEDSAAYRARKRPSKLPEQEAQLIAPSRHPLGDSQPITVSQPVSDDQVLPGKYMDVLTQRRNQFAVHTVGLRMGSDKGLHPRFNPSTGAVDGVPIQWDIGQNLFLKGSVLEKPDATVLSLSLQNLKRVRVRIGDVGGVPYYQTILCWTEGEPGTSNTFGSNPTASSGTWTPAFTVVGAGSITQPTITYSNTDRWGKWHRVGQLIFVTGRIKLTAHTLGTGGDNIVITGLPFTVLSGDTGYGVGVVAFKASWGTRGPENLYAEPGTTQMAMFYHTNTTGALVPPANLTANSDMIFSCWYWAA